MANVLTRQVLEDGPRIFAVKLVGVLDTSDIAATGQIGSGGFTTTAGSPVVTFTAGALVPTLGQYVTFSDGTTTFNANTYIISVDSATQITLSSNAKVNNAAAAVTITGTAGSVVICDPAKVWPVLQQQAATDFIFWKAINYMIEPTLEVRLDWEATANAKLLDFTGSGHTPDYAKVGGIQNNSGAGKTGRVVLSTQGWAATAVLNFTLALEFIKRGA